MDQLGLCQCGRSFTQPSALVKHRRTCQKSKKHISSALDRAKLAWTVKKRRRLGAADPQPLLATHGLVRASSPMIQDTPQVCHSSYANVGN